MEVTQSQNQFEKQTAGSLSDADEIIQL